MLSVKDRKSLPEAMEREKLALAFNAEMTKMLIQQGTKVRESLSYVKDDTKSLKKILKTAQAKVDKAQKEFADAAMFCDEAQSSVRITDRVLTSQAAQLSAALADRDLLAKKWVRAELSKLSDRHNELGRKIYPPKIKTDLLSKGLAMLARREQKQVEADMARFNVELEELAKMDQGDPWPPKTKAFLGDVEGLLKNIVDIENDSKKLAKHKKERNTPMGAQRFLTAALKLARKAKSSEDRFVEKIGYTPAAIKKMSIKPLSAKDKLEGWDIEDLDIPVAEPSRREVRASARAAVRRSRKSGGAIEFARKKIS